MTGCSREGCNCWTLVSLIYKEQFDIELPGYVDQVEDLTTRDVAEIQHVIERNYGDWVEVDTPVPGDAVLMRVNGLNCHVGLVIAKNEMIHVLKGIHTSRERFDSPLWKHRITGYYRHKERF